MKYLQDLWAYTHAKVVIKERIGFFSGYHINCKQMLSQSCLAWYQLYSNLTIQKLSQNKFSKIVYTVVFLENSRITFLLESCSKCSIKRGATSWPTSKGFVSIDSYSSHAIDCKQHTTQRITTHCHKCGSTCSWSSTPELQANRLFKL